MSEAYFANVNPFLDKISRLQKLEMTAAIHCSKINSLIRSYKILPKFIASNPPPNWKNTQTQISYIDSLNNSIDHLIQLCIQCNRESCVQLILMVSLQTTFEEFLSIRTTTISDLKNLNFPQAADLFVLTSDELLSQDQVDLKLIGNFLYQIRSQRDLSGRNDVKDRIIARFDSLKRKDIKIDPIPKGLDLDSGIITIPSIPTNLDLVLDHEQLVYQDLIGEGRSGKVYKGNLASRPDAVVAIKVLHCQQLSPSELEMFRREIFTLSTLSHPSILKLLGYTNQLPFCLVTELLGNGSLYRFLLSKPQELTPTDRMVIAIDVAYGMQYIHERNIIHRDLKSLNILLDDEKRARICDFGLVRLKSYAPMTGLIGTPQWMAPEILMCSTSYNIKVDVYSYGIVLWELLTGKLPYEGISVGKLPFYIVQEKLRPKIPPETPPDLANLITSCWSPDPNERPSFSDILKLFNNKNYHFIGADTNELIDKIRGKKRRTPSTAETLDLMDNSSFSDPEPIETPKNDPDVHISPNSLGKEPHSAQLIRQSKSIDIHKTSKTINASSAIKAGVGHNQVDQVVIQYSDAIKTNNDQLFDHCLAEFHSLYKTNLLYTIPNNYVPITVKMLRQSIQPKSSEEYLYMNDELRIKMLETLSGFLSNRVLFDQFVISEGFSVFIELMKMPDPFIADLVLNITSKHLRRDIITIELIQALLAFNTYNNSKTRNVALTTLFLVLELQFNMLCTMPSFIYHLLCFALKPLSLQMIEQLLRVTIKFIDKIEVFPESVMPQLIWLQANVPRQFESLAIECLVASVRLKDARFHFPAEFWRYAMKDFSSYRQLFRSFVHATIGKVHIHCNCSYCLSKNLTTAKPSPVLSINGTPTKEIMLRKSGSVDLLSSYSSVDIDFEEKPQRIPDHPIVDMPPKIDELVIVLKELSAVHNEALKLLNELTVDVRCAAIALNHLPIANLSSPALLFNLYSNLSRVENSSSIIGEKKEFYTICKLVLGSKFENDVCQLIRKVGLNPSLLESSGLVDEIVFLIFSSSTCSNIDIKSYTLDSTNKLKTKQKSTAKPKTPFKSKQRKSNATKIKIERPRSFSSSDDDNVPTDNTKSNNTIPSVQNEIKSARTALNPPIENKSSKNLLNPSINLNEKTKNPRPSSASFAIRYNSINGKTNSIIGLSDEKERNEDNLWNLLSVIYTLSKSKCYHSFQYITQTLFTLMTNNSNISLRIAAFLCLVNFSTFSFDQSTSNSDNQLSDISVRLNLLTVLIGAAEFVNKENQAVQPICVDCLNQNIGEMSEEDLRKIISAFLQFYDEQQSAINPEIKQFGEILHNQALTVFHNEISEAQTNDNNHGNDGVFTEAMLIESLGKIVSANPK